MWSREVLRLQADGVISKFLFLPAPDKVSVESSCQFWRSLLHGTKHWHKVSSYVSYKISIVQQLQGQNYAREVHFFQSRRDRISSDSWFLCQVVSSEKYVFRISWSLTTHNTYILGTKIITETQQHVLLFEKLAAWCAMNANNVVGPYYWNDVTGRGVEYYQCWTLTHGHTLNNSYRKPFSSNMQFFLTTHTLPFFIMKNVSELHDWKTWSSRLARKLTRLRPNETYLRRNRERSSGSDFWA